MIKTETLEPCDEWQELEYRPVRSIHSAMGSASTRIVNGVGQVLAPEGFVAEYDVGDDLMKAWFGDELSNWGPVSHLMDHGWIKDNGVWSMAGVNHFEDIDYKERKCLEFLMVAWGHEWKKGGVPVRR